MRIFLRRPSQSQLRSLLQRCDDDSVTCDEPGVSKSWTMEMFESRPVSELRGDQLWKFRRETIGSGEMDFKKASDALLNAKCFDLPWVTCIANRPFNPGDSFCLNVKAFGLWAANFCRVIYIKDSEGASDDGPKKNERMVSVGIATLRTHAAIGEERLSVMLNRSTGTVEFMIGSYSKPSSILSNVFAWYLRRRQDAFAIDATRRMKSAILAEGDVIGTN